MNTFIRRLLKESLLSPESLQEAISAAEQQQVPLVTYLIHQKTIHLQTLAKVIAEDFGLPFMDLDAVDKSQLPVHLMHERLLSQHAVLPLLQEGKTLYVAVADPTQQSVLDEIKFQTGFVIQAVLVAKDQLDALIEELLTMQQTSIHSLQAIELDSNQLPLELHADTLSIMTEDDAPTVRYVNKILLHAIHQQASDIHFEPFDQVFRIRFRIDGLLHTITELPLRQASCITARLKIMSQLDIAERRLPQDGRLKITVDNKRAVDCRLSTCPTIHGEKTVVRILDANKMALEIDQLGLTDLQKDIFCQALKNPQGMILVTGPTGSGKTVTLYTALSLLNTDAINISTVEDPVEIPLLGVNQVNINPKAGIDFAIILRAFLRQDPDLLVIGEMRDLETAEIGVKAAQTGHLVLSTLHTNSAAETLTRLMNIGILNYNIATSLRLIISQRLARKLCPDCKQETTLPRPNAALLQAGFSDKEIPAFKIFEPQGCSSCRQGYKGRVGIFELLSVNPLIAELIMRGESALAIAEQARREGMQTLRIAALMKIQEGLTSFSEVNRIL